MTRQKCDGFWKVTGNDQIIVNQKQFTTPPGPSLTSIDPVSLKSGDLDTVVLTLNGQRMPVATFVSDFKLTVVETGTNAEIPIPVSFSTDTLGSGEAKAYSPSTLKYDTDYTVLRLKSTVIPVSIPSTVTFKTPAAPVRILSVKCNLDAASGKAAEVVLTGVALPQSTSFILNVYELDSSSAKVGDAFELSSSFLADGQTSSHTLSHLIYGESSPKLKYNTSYLITDLQVSGRTTIVSSDVTFDVPPEPGRILSSSPALNGAKSQVDVTLNGVKLTDIALNVTLKHSTTGRSFISELSFIDSQACSVSFPAAQTEDETHLQFGQTYLVMSIASADGTNTFYFNDGLSIEVPPAPIVTTITPTLSPNCTHFELSFSGLTLPSNVAYTLYLDPSGDLPITFSNGHGTSGWLKDGDCGLHFGTLLPKPVTFQNPSHF
ncbi:hypothetical protein BLNAU_20434 [Blattamonas nauphoetae]|uniref:Uncharacterized protein n=1 Tax=Blattamonas nauphoetae TaxID=2049346 RepID=A0ABQ9X2V7_9EUKA|nr:hypothetical protein BLNAU_20434 [Blattamonas nauphoetae]